MATFFTRSYVGLSAPLAVVRPESETNDNASDTSDE